MRSKFIISLLLTLFCVVPYTGSALAVPAQRQVTVVNKNDQVVFIDYIRYNNTYTQPKVIIPKPSPAPSPAKPAITVSRSDRSDARQVVNIANDLIGSSYVYAASGPNSFDCSGFTMYVYKQIGFNLPHLASDQYNYGVKVSKDNLIPGDLVFFGYYGGSGIDHVGIYVGDGYFTHASTSNGVIKTALSSSYYTQNYKGAVRLIR